jgi:hypothetical protein
VELACEAHKVLKAIDTRNMIVSPSASAGARDQVDYLDRFLAAGGRKCVDIVGHHFYVPNAPPESMIPLIRAVKKAMTANGVGHLPLWNTETGYWIANGDGTADHPMVAKGGWKKLGLSEESGDYLARAFLIARAEGVDRFYWYSWDNRYGLGMIEPTTGQPKPMTAKWKALASALIGARNLQCTPESSNGWKCSFIRSNGASEVVSWKSN